MFVLFISNENPTKKKLELFFTNFFWSLFFTNFFMHRPPKLKNPYYCSSFNSSAKHHQTPPSSNLYAKPPPSTSSLPKPPPVTTTDCYIICLKQPPSLPQSSLFRERFGSSIHSHRQIWFAIHLLLVKLVFLGF